MSAADAQWIVVGFLNLACQIAVVMLLAGGAEVLVKRSGAGPKAFVWTMALVSLVVVIGARLASSPITRAPVRFAEARQGSESEWGHFDSSEKAAENPGGIFAEHPMPDVRESEADEKAFPNAMEAVSTERARESHGNDLVREESETEAPLPWDAERQPFSPASRRRSADTSVNVRVKETTNSWQVAGWGVAALCLVSALLLLRVLFGTLSLKNLILRWRARDASAALNGTLDELKRVLGMKRRVRFLISPKNGAPIAFGTFRPTIILPSGLMERIGTEGVRQMLAHELAHVRRYDSLVILLQRVCTALCFWHPLVHVANRRLRILIEDACDDCVLRITREPRAYADCLTKLAEQKLCRLPGIAGWIGAKRKRLKLERRIQKILDRGRPLGPLSAVAAMAMVLIAAIVSLVSGRIPVFGIAGEEGISAKKMQAAEAEALTPLKGETPLKHAQRLLMEGYASPAIEVLRKAIGESDDPGTATGLRYELARAYHLLVNTQNLEKTSSEIWATLPADVEKVDDFADFCIRCGQERLATEAIERLQELEPEKRVYHASRLYGAFPRPAELWIPFQPKPLEKKTVEVGQRTGVIYRECLGSGLIKHGLAADLDGDGNVEVVADVQAVSGPVDWVGLFSQEGELLWKDDWGESSVEVHTFDLNGDGRQEVIAAGFAQLKVYDYRGRLLWEHSRVRGEPGWSYCKARIIASRENLYRVIAGAGSRLMCFLPNGYMEWEKGSFWASEFFAEDVNGDGWDEIITRRAEDGSVAVLDQRGEEMPGVGIQLSKQVRVIAVVDINGDGKAEVVAKEGGPTLVGYALDGRKVWERPLGGDPPRFAAGDLDGDGKKEIAYTPPGGGLRVLNADASVRFELVTRLGDVQFADLHGDGKDELLAVTRGESDSYLLCIGGEGALRWRFPMPPWYGSMFSVTTATPGTGGAFVLVHSPGIVLSPDGKVISTIATVRHPRAFLPDLNGDGKRELISMSPAVRTYDILSNRALWGGVIPMSYPWWLRGSCVMDIDGDGADELVFTSAGYVGFLNGSGQLVRARYVGQFGERPHVIRIDLQGDGKDEILFCDARRFLVLNKNLEAIAAALHEEYDEQEMPATLTANVDSQPGDEILVCRDPHEIVAYSTKAQVVSRFRRPPWLPLREDYVWPRILPPMDVDGDGEKDLVALTDRLFVWNLRGELLDIGLNDYPKHNEVFGALLVPRVKAIIKYVKELGAHGSINDYLKEADKEFEMEVHGAICPARIGDKPAFAVSSFRLLKLIQADGEVLWQVREGDIGLGEMGFGDFDGDGNKDIVIRGWRRLSSETKARTAILAYSLQGSRLAEIELEGWSFGGPLFEDFDGDGFMEVAIGSETGIAVVDMTP